MALKNYKEKVYHILKKHPSTRNNDGRLLAFFIVTYCKNLVFKNQEGKVSMELEDLDQLPPIENVRRSRQIIQNDDGDFPPTDPEVAKERGIKQKDWRDKEVREAKDYQVRVHKD